MLSKLGLRFPRDWIPSPEKETFLNDVASLLYDAKADLPPDFRQQLLDHYLATLRNFIDIKPEARNRTSQLPRPLPGPVQNLRAITEAAGPGCWTRRSARCPTWRSRTG